MKKVATQKFRIQGEWTWRDQISNLDPDDERKQFNTYEEALNAANKVVADGDWDAAVIVEARAVVRNKNKQEIDTLVEEF